ncbi:MAG: FkbM family methyltransferase, partial [Patescibacteria group bacterium]|nr:FkbM family methyltransferase [Patescibacteria group bacterium]
IEYNNNLDKLIKDLDEKSILEVKNILKRNHYVYSNNLLNLSSQFKPDEIIEQKDCVSKIKKFNKKFRKASFNSQGVESIWGLSGLKWLNDESINRLKNGTFLDIGAYNGDSSFALMDSFLAKSIFAFEADNINYLDLNNNINSLKLKNIIPVNLAIGDQNKEVNIEINGTSSKISNKGQKILMTTIDNYVEENNIQSVDLIKMDIEGFEQKALKGAINTIKSFKPILAISIYHNANDFFEIKPMLEDLNIDYKFYIKKANSFSLNEEVMLIAY